MRPMISMLSSRSLRKLTGLRTMKVLSRMFGEPKRVTILKKAWTILRDLRREKCWRKNVWRTEEGNNLEESVDDFERSQEGKMLEKEFEDLDEALKEHVKVSDVPEDWKDDMFLF